MAALQKFMFDRTFDRPAPAVAPILDAANASEAAAEIAEAAAPPPPTYSEEDLQTARAEALAQGREEGHKEAAESIEREVRDALNTAENALRELMWSQSAIETQATEDAIRVALAAIRRLFPALAEHAPLAEIERMVRETMTMIQGEAALNIYINDRLREPFAARLQEVIAAAGFQERVVLHGAAALGPSDCRIEWTAGGVARDTAAILKAIEETAARAIPALLSEPVSPAATDTTPAEQSPTAQPSPEDPSAEKPSE